jgi:ABC-2 type transport system permease protein
MSVAAVIAVGLGAAERQVVRTLKTPALLLPVLLFPLLIFGSFVGGASGVSKTPGFGYYNYTAFVFVYVLLLGAGMSGAQTGVALAQDFESGFARRMLVSTPRRAALLVGCAVSGLAQQTGLAAVTILIALAAGMPIHGNVLDVVGVFALAALFNLAATLWASGLAFRARSTQAGPAMMLPILLPMFFAPSLLPRNLLTGWLHTITDFNPLTALLEAGRGLLAGHPVSVALAFGILGGLVALTALWAVSGLRAAERGA